MATKRSLLQGPRWMLNCDLCDQQAEGCETDPELGRSGWTFLYCRMQEGVIEGEFLLCPQCNERVEIIWRMMSRWQKGRAFLGAPKRRK